MRLTDDDIMKLINKANSLYAHKDYSGHDVMQASQDVLFLVADLREARAVIDAVIEIRGSARYIFPESVAVDIDRALAEYRATDPGIKGEGCTECGAKTHLTTFCKELPHA
jgi:hypothetical protein